MARLFFRQNSAHRKTPPIHPNQAFRKTPQDLLVAFARQRSFGSLALSYENGPLISHIPFQLSQDGTYLEAHPVRSNPMLQLLDEAADAVIATTGPDGYISPDWYGVDNQVPIWNHVAVHICGKLRKLDESELRGILERLSASMEARLAPKPPWTIDKMDAEIFQRMQRQIVSIAMTVDSIQGTFKLSQNKPDAIRSAAADGVRNGTKGTETAALADLMDLRPAARLFRAEINADVN
uniref:FMN-binding negative transcriptional regulator n=1 Tax=Pararhizobium sp. IMCC3301 TaxID=3067904 RepID=UPI0027428DAE|nr:FMN-binding negative transcriptional regulator [Pararhizobium sp. IMCC3301]